MSPEKYEPGEAELPEGWDPVQDNDPLYQAITRLAREADQPQMPPPALFEAVRMETRNLLLDEGLLKPAGASQEEAGFGAWLHTVLFGGRLGGQMVRLGTVAIVGFLAGVQLYSPVAETPSVTSPGQPTITANAGPTNDSEEPTFTAIPGSRVDVADAVPVSDRSPLQDSIIQKGLSPAGWQATAPSGDAWRGLMHATAASTPGTTGPAHGTFNETSRDPATRVLDQLQLLKFNSIVTNDEQEFAALRRLEDTLAELIHETQFDTGSRTMALQKYRAAEEALAARQYARAQAIFEEVAFLSPGSSLAFLSQFHIGTIAREHTGDFELALEVFRECLEKFPAQSVPARQRQYLQQQVEILSQGEAEDWASLRSFQAAENATDPRVRASHLVTVVSNSPSGRLATEAAEGLRQLVMEDVNSRRLDWAQISSALRERVNSTPPGPDTARIQFCLAEISALAEGDFLKAAQEYQRATSLEPDARTMREIRSRMNFIGNQSAPE